jgi:L,D-transpeptidase ErfK/SrfK
MTKRILRLLFALAAIIPNISFALSFSLAANGDSVVGAVQTATIQPGQDLHEIARQYDLGYDELLIANPDIRPNKIYRAKKIIIPTLFLLPSVTRQGIVINLAEERLYYFPPNQNIVYTFPIGVGKNGWATPTAYSSVIEKIKNPVWTVPESINKNLSNYGIYVPKKILPGPDDPLGNFALRLNVPGYLIHGTNEPESVGMRSSSGCIRMYPENIEQLFGVVATHTPVHIIYAPYKAGWSENKFFLEVHPAMSDVDQVVQAEIAAQNVKTLAAAQSVSTQQNQDVRNSQALRNAIDTQPMAAPVAVNPDSINDVIKIALNGRAVTIYKNLARRVISQHDGIPQPVGFNPDAPSTNTGTQGVAGAQGVQNPSTQGPEIKPSTGAALNSTTGTPSSVAATNPPVANTTNATTNSSSSSSGSNVNLPTNGQANVESPNIASSSLPPIIDIPNDQTQVTSVKVN